MCDLLWPDPDNGVGGAPYLEGRATRLATMLRQNFVIKTTSLSLRGHISW